MTPQAAAERIDDLLAHVWVVRTFLKHSEEAEEDDELREAVRGLYDFMLALGAVRDDPAAYLRLANKKIGKFQKAVDLFLEIQPEVSDHTNFKMAARSLTIAAGEIRSVLQAAETNQSSSDNLP